MRILFNTLVIGVTAIFLSSSYSVYASEQQVFKCTKDNKVSFQDQPCADSATSEIIVMREVEYSKNPGLRDYEKVILQRSADRRAEDKAQRAIIRKAIIDRQMYIDYKGHEVIEIDLHKHNYRH